MTMGTALVSCGTLVAVSVSRYTSSWLLRAGGAFVLLKPGQGPWFRRRLLLARLGHLTHSAQPNYVKISH
jgi:hypothetical protein